MVSAARTETSGGDASRVQQQLATPLQSELTPTQDPVPIQQALSLTDDDVAKISAISSEPTTFDLVNRRLAELHRQVERIASRSEAGSGELRAIAGVIDAANVSMRQTVQEDIGGIKKLMGEVRANQIAIRNEVNRVRLDMKSAHTHMLIEVQSMIGESEKRRMQELDRLVGGISQLQTELREHQQKARHQPCVEEVAHGMLFDEVVLKNEFPFPVTTPCPEQKRHVGGTALGPVTKKTKRSESGGQPSTSQAKPAVCMARRSGKSATPKQSTSRRSLPILEGRDSIATNQRTADDDIDCRSVANKNSISPVS